MKVIDYTKFQKAIDNTKFELAKEYKISYTLNVLNGINLAVEVLEKHLKDFK